MMRAKHVTILAALLSLSAAAYAQTQGVTPGGVTPGGATQGGEPTAAGLWQALDDDTHQPTGWFLIRDNGGVFSGAIAKMYLKPGEDPNVVCDHCKDDRYSKPWLGLEIIRGMKRDGLKYEDGTILDPRDGSIYSAMMTLTPDGQTLVVRGYLGISLLGRDQYWTRLPDAAYNELDPAINPNKPAVPAPHKSAATPKAAPKSKPENSAQR